MKFSYFDITENMLYLKSFLKIRDHHDTFRLVREKGQVGVPCLFVDNQSYLVQDGEHTRKLITDLDLPIVPTEV